jgi:hypothetical protein
VKPPAESGLAWHLHHDVELHRGGESGMISTGFELPSPLVLAGSLSYPAGSDPELQSLLEGAEVRAVVMIDDPQDGDRSIAVGKAVADHTGAFTLLLPQRIKMGF